MNVLSIEYRILVYKLAFKGSLALPEGGQRNAQA